MPLGSWLLIIQEFLRTADGEGTLVSPETGRYLFTGITPVARGEDYAMGWNMTNRHWDIDVANHSGTNLANFAVAWLGLQRGYAYVGVMNAGFDDATDNGIVDELITELISWHQHNR